MTNKTTLQRLKLDPYFSKTIETNLNVWSHDQNSYEIKFEFYDQQCNKPISLKNAVGRVLLLFSGEGNKKHVLNLDIESEVLGLAKIVIPKRILGYEGIVNAHIYIDFEDKTHDFGSFLFKMNRSAIDDDFPELDTIYVSEFEKALEDIKEFKVNIDKNINDMENKFDGVYEKAKNDMDEITHLITENNVALKSEVETLEKETKAKFVNQDKEIKASYDTLNEKLSLKMDKDTMDISVNQINKNKGKIDQTFLSEDLLEQISGEAEINAVPAFRSITNNKIANGSIDSRILNNYLKEQTIKTEKKLGSIGHSVTDKKDLGIKGKFGYATASGYLHIHGKPSDVSGLLKVNIKLREATTITIKTLEKKENENSFITNDSKRFELKKGVSEIETDMIIEEGQYVAVSGGSLSEERNNVTLSYSHFRTQNHIDNKYNSAETFDTKDWAFYYEVGGYKSKIEDIYDKLENIQTKNNMIYVSDFGETGEAIQEALELAGYGDVVVLEGGKTYDIEKTIRLKSGVTLKSFGSNAILKLADKDKRNLTDVWWRSGNRKEVIVTTDFVDSAEKREQLQVSDITIENITVIGNTDEFIENGLVAVLLSNVENAKAINVVTKDINYFNSAVTPSRGFGLTTRYCDKVELLHCSGERSHYENLAIYDNSKNVFVLNAKYGKAGRTSGQVHRNCSNITISGGSFINYDTLDPDGQTSQAFTVHGEKNVPVDNLQMDNVLLETRGEYGGIALSAFGNITRSNFNLKTVVGKSQNINIANTIDCKISGCFYKTEDSEYAIEVKASNKNMLLSDFVVDSYGSGINVWGEHENTKMSNFTIKSNGNSFSSGAVNGLSVHDGSFESVNGTGVIQISANQKGLIKFNNVSVRSKLSALSISSKSEYGKTLIFSNSLFSTTSNSPAVDIWTDYASVINNRIEGIVRLRADKSCLIKGNDMLNGDIEFIGTAKDQHYIIDNIVRS